MNWFIIACTNDSNSCEGSSRIVNIFKSVHRVPFFVPPYLPKEYFENVDLCDLI